MNHYILELEVKLPDDFNESAIDEAVECAIASAGGQLMDSKSFCELPKEEWTD